MAVWTRFPPQPECLVGNDQEQRTILAVGLSLLVYMVYLQWFAPPMTAAVPPDESANAIVETPAGAPVPVGIPASDEPANTEVAADGQINEPTEPEPQVMAIADHELTIDSDTFGAFHHKFNNKLFFRYPELLYLEI